MNHNESARRIHLPVRLEPTITAFCLAMVLGLSYDLGGLYPEPGSLQSVFSLGVVLMGLGWLNYMVAVVAFYSNRNAMCWSRVAGGAAPRARAKRGRGCVVAAQP